jgi:N-sulfoglucosamine sulfohydrolase
MCRALLPVVALAAFSHLPAADQRPNIVFIVSDDHSAPHLGAYGFPVKTPNLDRFASEGMLFNHFFTAAPQCAPSRAAFATGRSPVAAQASRFSSPVPREIPFFPELLRRDAGYFTGICRRAAHLDGYTNADDQISPAIWEKHHLKTLSDRFDYVNMGGGRKETSAKVAKFLDQVPAAKPFFLWVNFNDPHHPWDAPRLHDPATLPLPPDWPDLPGLRNDFAIYLDEIARMDGEFQWVLDELDKRHLSENTIVIFVGDNGVALPLGKGSLHDRSLNVPFAVRWPGRIAPGTRSTTLVSGEDIAPTLLAAAGLPALPEMTGHNILPTLLGRSDYQPREYIFAMRGIHGSAILDEHSVSSGIDLARAVRSERYKLILNYTPWIPYEPVDSAADPGWQQILTQHREHALAPVFERLYFKSPRPFVELYDLAEDPGELRNLAGQAEYAGIERQLKIVLMEKMITDFDYLPLPLRQ